MDDVLLRVTGMKKIFGPTTALGGVDFVLKSGEIHGLVGENGSGKSTLASIIAGMQGCDGGAMEKDGQPYCPVSAIDAQRLGVAMIVQEMGTAPGIGIADNIFLGKERQFKTLGFVSRKKMRKAAALSLQNIGAGWIDPALSIETLNFEDRKIIELAKAMDGNPSVLIVDETTTALSVRGRELLYALMDRIKNAGGGVIFISHDLEELTDVCTDITVLRDGVIIGSLVKESFEADLLKSMMVGRELKGDFYRGDFDGSFSDEVVLRCGNLSGALMIENICLELHKGEILGIGGLSNSGMHELGRLMFGLDKAITGSVTLSPDVAVTSAKVAVAHGVGYVSKNRDQEALMLRASIKDNIVLSALRQLMKGPRISAKSEIGLAKKNAELLEVKSASINQEVRYLSGGNKQKVVFAKWLGNDSRILILDCPTRGVDVGVKNYMYQIIYKLKTQGYSILLISEELPELIGMSDRILILKGGRLSGEFERRASLSEQEIIQSMI